MPMITFLTATVPSVPLTKTITKTAKGIETNAYPNAFKFNSDTQNITHISELAKVLFARLDTGQCLLKGKINKELKNQPRAGTTSNGDQTQWICFDLDNAPFKTPQEFMELIKMGDVAHVVQYSASHGLPHKTGLSCHVFAFLDKPLPAPQLKNWLIYLNLNVKELREGLKPSDTAIALSYPLDITTCQNDKLLFFGAPTFIGIADPIKSRVQFVPGKQDTINTNHIALHAPEALKKMAKEILNEKRKLLQLPPLNAKTTLVGEYEVQNSPGEMNITGGPKLDRGFVYFNINNGSNWSYYHPESNFELIHNFKGEPCIRTKDAFPDYYKECVKQRNVINSAPPMAGSTTILAYRDRRTSTYWNGTWNPETEILHCDPARSETQIEHFLLSHGQQALPFIPIWDRIFDPSPGAKVIDMDAKPYPTMNLFSPTEYMRKARDYAYPNLGGCPTINRIIEHAVGSGDTLEHFYNWLAVSFQKRVKPGTAWVLHGVEGTGKDMLVDNIITPLFGKQWVPTRNQTELNSDFTGWLEHALIAHVREIEINSLENGGAVESKIKNYIVDNTIPIRRMRVDSYEVVNHIGLIFSSNKSQPVRISQSDRRFNVGIFQHVKLVVTNEEVREKIPSELQAFADYLRSRVADDEVSRVPLRNADRDNIIALSMTSAEHTARYLLDGNLEGLWEAMPDEKMINELYGTTPMATYANAFASLMRKCLSDYMNRKESRLSREELGMVFQYCVGNVPTSPNKLTQYLAHHGLRTERFRDRGLMTYGLRIDWTASDSFIKDVTVPVEEAVKPLKLRRAK